MKYLAWLSLLLVCFSCESDGAGNGIMSGNGEGEAAVSFSENGMKSYISLYEALKKEVPDALEDLNENGVSSPEVQQVVEASGMDYNDFTAMNVKVGLIYSLCEVNMGTFESINDLQQNQMTEAANSFQEMLDDPDIPEDKKAEIRIAIEQLNQGKGLMSNMWEQNKKKAAELIKRAQKKLNGVATEEEVALVLQHQDALKSAYDGLFRPGAQETQRF